MVASRPGLHGVFLGIRHICWRFQRPRLNKNMLTPAIAASAITTEKNTPAERRPAGMARQVRSCSITCCLLRTIITATHRPPARAAACVIGGTDRICDQAVVKRAASPCTSG